MRHYLIATHGTLSNGFLNAIRMIAGDLRNITVISAYIENVSVEEQAKGFLDGIKEEDEVVVFTDIMGGSVNQYFMTQLNRKHFHLITGINLAVIIAVLYLSEDKYLEASEVESEVENARSQLIYMNEYMKRMTVEEDDLEN